jgi:diguanylate cyclase (GGDEF)-like protein
MLHDITSQKQIQNELFALSITDSLTGLPNRREFFEKLPLRIAEAKRNQNDLTLVMIDIDNFKQINDTLTPDGRPGDETHFQCDSAIASNL